MAVINCPKCGGLAKRGGFAVWQILVSIFFFPIGLVSLVAGRQPNRCNNCGHTWV